MITAIVVDDSVSEAFVKDSIECLFELVWGAGQCGVFNFEGEIVVEGRNLREWNLQALQKKITLLREHEVDFALQAGFILL